MQPWGVVTHACLYSDRGLRWWERPLIWLKLMKDPRLIAIWRFEVETMQPNTWRVASMEKKLRDGSTVQLRNSGSVPYSYIDIVSPAGEWFTGVAHVEHPNTDRPTLTLNRPLDFQHVQAIMDLVARDAELSGVSPAPWLEPVADGE